MTYSVLLAASSLHMSWLQRLVSKTQPHIRTSEKPSATTFVTACTSCCRAVDAHAKAGGVGFLEEAAGAGAEWWRRETRFVAQPGSTVHGPIPLNLRALCSSCLQHPHASIPFLRHRCNPSHPNYMQVPTHHIV